MKPLDILASLPQWSNATHKELLASPAWALPCRFGETQCAMHHAEIRPTETLDIAIRLESESHILGIADSPAFPELHAIWSSRTDVPEPILLALIEKDCGPLLQLIENAVRRQLKIEGLRSGDTESDAAETANVMAFDISIDATTKITFTLTTSTAMETAFGQLRNIDPAHPSVRDATLTATTEYAAFSIPDADLAMLTPGDALLMPEIDTIPPRLIVEGKLVMSATDIAPWQDDGRLRVCSAEDTTITVGSLLSANDSASLQPPPENTSLRLVRSNKTLANGHLEHIATQYALVVDDKEAVG